MITQMQLEYHRSTQLQLHLHSHLNTWLHWIGQRQLQDEMRNISGFFCLFFYTRGLTVAQVLLNNCYERRLIYPTWPILWVLWAWWYKEPGHQQTWNWPCSPQQMHVRFRTKWKIPCRQHIYIFFLTENVCIFSLKFLWILSLKLHWTASAALV